MSRGYRFGVFATGGDPYGKSRRDPDYDARAELITALTGTATYEGDASGVWSRSDGRNDIFSERRNDIFSADATLTIDFSAKLLHGGEGTAIGRIHDMEIGGTPIAGNPEIALSGGQVRIDGQVWAAHIGKARMTFNGESWRGKWDAALFGSPASGATGADRLPGSVAGAFGVATGGEGFTTRREGADYIVGAFGAYRTEWTDAPEGVRQDAP